MHSMEGLQHPVAIPEHVAMPANPGKGGRPKSSVWKFFETERKRDDKSKREDVRCRCVPSTSSCVAAEFRVTTFAH